VLELYFGLQGLPLVEYGDVTIRRGYFNRKEIQRENVLFWYWTTSSLYRESELEPLLQIVFCFEFTAIKGKHPIIETGSFVNSHIMGITICKTQESSPSVVSY
jgi:hypothetical protein